MQALMCVCVCGRYMKTAFSIKIKVAIVHFYVSTRTDGSRVMCTVLKNIKQYMHIKI